MMFATAGVNGQEFLTLWDCLAIASEKNIDIRSLEMLNEINTEELKMTRTGLLPDISANANISEAIQDSRIRFIDDIIPPSEITGARTNGQSMSLNTNLNFTSFAASIATNKAGRFNVLAQENSQIDEQNRILLGIATAYLDALIRTETQTIFLHQVESSENLFRIAEHQIKLGVMDSATYYQAMVHLEEDYLSKAELEIQVSYFTRELLRLIGLDKKEVVLDDLTNVNMAGLIVAQSSIDSNAVLRQKQAEIQALKHAKRAGQINYLPSLSAFAAYGFSNQTFQNGIVVQSTYLGPSYGLGITYQLTSIKQAKHQVEIAKIQSDIALEQLLDIEVRLKNDLDRINAEIEQLKITIQIKEKLAEIAEMNLAAGITGFEVGRYSIFELRTFQMSVLQAKLEAKASVTDLVYKQLEKLALTGDLKRVFLTQINQP